VLRKKNYTSGKDLAAAKQFNWIRPDSDVRFAATAAFHAMATITNKTEQPRAGYHCQPQQWQPLPLEPRLLLPAPLLQQVPPLYKNAGDLLACGHHNIVAVHVPESYFSEHCTACQTQQPNAVDPQIK